MSARIEAIRSIGKKHRTLAEALQIKHSAKFCSRVFHRTLIQELPKEVAQNWLDVLDGKAKLNVAYVDRIADALKNWAMKHGATHFTHWFQPLSCANAQKHDSFLQWGPNDSVLEKFGGKDLLRGEPDASSFPSGGLRATHQGRGYTVWDPTTFPFLWEGGDGMVLCIPTLFFSCNGEALDHKIPLMRSEEKLNQVVLRLLKLFQVDADRVISNLGAEQEYFVIDRSLFLLRPDLVLAGRTVFGAKSPKGQELEDHYFGSVNDRVLAFMREFEEVVLQIGVPIKTRHNEVAPAQHEVAPLFERASWAVDHNVLLMEAMRGVALKHNLACLFHEKPFMGINGSGKHTHWSVATDKGENLLDPEGNRMIFLTLFTAILEAVNEHAALLRASIAVPGNEDRLGGSEAPPTILSVYLGEALEKMIGVILHGEPATPSLKTIDLGLSSIPRYEIDPSDRNRTSFFAFTGNKFEFRAVGSSAHTALPITVINAIVADSLALLLDEIDSIISDRQMSPEEIFVAILPILKSHLKNGQKVVFAGNNYSLDWEREAEERGLPNIRKGFDSLSLFIDKKSVRLFKGILNEAELQSRYEIMVEQYGKTMQIEAQLMLELFQTQLLPAAQKDMKQRGIQEPLIDQAIKVAVELKKLLSQMNGMGWEAKGKVFCELVGPKMRELRNFVDQLEEIVDNALWPLPKYRELLFIL